MLSLSCRVCLDTIPSCITYARRFYHSRFQWVTLPTFGSGGARRRSPKLWRMKKKWHEIHCREVQKQNCIRRWTPVEDFFFLSIQSSFRGRSEFIRKADERIPASTSSPDDSRGFWIVSGWRMQWFIMNNQYRIHLWLNISLTASKKPNQYCLHWFVARDNRGFGQINQHAILASRHKITY